MTPDLVSVIIPTHNRHAQLVNAVRSALSQTYGSIEVIVFDDASTPPVSLPQDLLSDGRLHLIRGESNIGPSAARIKAIRKSSGYFLAFLDDDDEWFPEKIEKQIKAAHQTSEAGIIECGFEAWDGERLAYRYIPDVGRDLRVDLLAAPCLAPSSVVIRRDAYEDVGGFDPSLRRMEDWDLWIRIVQSFPATAVPEVLLTRTFNRPDPAESMRHRVMIVDRIRPLIDALPLRERRRVYAHHDFMMGVSLVQLGESRKARQHLWRAWRSHPTRFRRLALIARTLTGEQTWQKGVTAARAVSNLVCRLVGRDPHLRTR